MPATKPSLLCQPLPPMRLAGATRQSVPVTPGLAPFRRGLFCLAALALPALGITLADQVHRAGEAGALQAAAAPLAPSSGSAAAPSGLLPRGREGATPTPLPPAALVLRASLPSDPSSPR